MKRRFAVMAQSILILLCILMLVAGAGAQENTKCYSGTVTGLITDAKGEPIKFSAAITYR